MNSGINLVDLSYGVIKPTLMGIGLYSPVADFLIAGTYLVEGMLDGEAHLRQIRGPALGLWQMEPFTHDDCWTNFLNFRPELAANIRAISLNGKEDSGQLVGNLYYACAMARIKYERAAAPLPGEMDPMALAAALAAYHKNFYNSAMGKANPDVNAAAFSYAINQLGG